MSLVSSTITMMMMNEDVEEARKWPAKSTYSVHMMVIMTPRLGNTLTPTSFCKASSHSCSNTRSDRRAPQGRRASLTAGGILLSSKNPSSPLMEANHENIVKEGAGDGRRGINEYQEAGSREVEVEVSVIIITRHRYRNRGQSLLRGRAIPHTFPH